MIKKGMILIALVAVLVGGYGWYLFNKKSDNLANKKPDFLVTANELFNAFEENESEANQKYVEQIVEITGIIDQIEQRDSLLNLILRADQAMIGGVNCQLNEEEDIRSYSEEDTITLKCLCQGYLMNVILNRCVIVDK